MPDPIVRRARWRALTISAVVGLCLAAAAPAAAAPPVPTTPEEITDTDLSIDLSPGPGGATAEATAGPATAEASRATADAEGQLSYVEAAAEPSTRPPITPPSEPSGAEVDACLDGSDRPGGKVYNRFLYCMTGDIRPRYIVNGVLEVGWADVDFQLVAYGRDDGQRNAKIFIRVTGARGGGWAGGPSTVVRFWVDCDPPTDAGCAAGGPTVADTVSGLNGDRSWHTFTVSSSANLSDAPDKVLRHRWTIRSQARFPGGWPFPGGETSVASHQSRTIRCDSATYFRGRNAACIHDQVIPHLQYRTSNDDVDEVAYHILTAQLNAADTWPDHGSAKRIPGRYIQGNPDAPGLHRVPYRGSDYRTNVAEKNAACRRTGEYAGERGLPPELYNPPVQQCDEYPFATTLEGAGSPNWDFSVLGVLASDNRCAGLALQRYYLEDRILYRQDEFYVQIHNDGPPPVETDPGVCPGEPGDWEDGAGGWDPEDN